MGKRKQLPEHRLERLLKGTCPIHGCSMSQIEYWHYDFDGKLFTIFQCDRKDCEVSARFFKSTQILELLADYQHLLAGEDISIEPSKLKNNDLDNEDTKTLFQRFIDSGVNISRAKNFTEAFSKLTDHIISTKNIEGITNAQIIYLINIGVLGFAKKISSAGQYPELVMLHAEFIAETLGDYYSSTHS